MPFFKGSLTWENNAIFSSHCFTLLQRRTGTINSERDHNLKPLKTDISTIVPWFDAMFGAWTGAQASPLSDLRDHVGLLNQQKCAEGQFSWFESLRGLRAVRQCCVNGLSLQWMHPKKMLFSAQNITCEVAYIWLVSNRLRLNNDSAGSHITGGR